MRLCEVGRRARLRAVLGEIVGATRRRGILLRVCAAVLCTTGAACTHIGTVVSYDDAIDFRAYHTYAWLSPTPLFDAATIDPRLTQYVRLAVSNTLARKGYRWVPDPATADFAVDFTIGTNEKIRQEYPPDSESTHIPIWGQPYRQAVDVRDFTEGRLMIDVYDVKTRQGVWHGHAKKNILRPTDSKSEADINDVVSAILDGFPPTTR